jgi:hypothetical protein
VNLIVHAQLFGENYGVARHAPMLLVKGRLERQGSVIHVLVQRAERIELTLRANAAPDDVVPPLVRSRDFH